MARSELSLAASLSRSCKPTVSIKAFDFPVWFGTQATRAAAREARFLLLLCKPDLEAEVASLLAELLRVVTSAMKIGVSI